MFELFTVKIAGTNQYICRVPSSYKDIKNCWTTNAQRVKLYVKPGPARSAMTIIARLAQEAGEPVPDIVLAKLTTTEEEINEDTRVAGAVDKIAHDKKRSDESNRAYKERCLQKSIDRNQKELDRLRKGM
jgi:hypothetical protein